MRIKLSSHGSYKHQYHIVWIPKYRRKVLKLGVKTYVSRGIDEITHFHPEIEIIKYNIQIDHVHLIIDIPPKLNVSSIVGKIKQNSSRKIRDRFEWLDKVYKKGVFWSPGYFSSTIDPREGQVEKHFMGEELDRIHNRMRWEESKFWTKCPRVVEKLLFSQSDKTIGIQIADLFCYPIFNVFEYDNKKYWRYNEQTLPKLHRSPNGVLEGWGLKVFP